MTEKEWMEWFRSFGLPSAYHHFEEGHSPAPPFLVYWFPASDNFGADNHAYYKASQIQLELYTNKKDLALEEQIETRFESRGLFFEKVELYLDTEKLYQIVYHLNQ